MPQVSANVTANYLKVKTGSQLGTPQLQALMIKTYNLSWGNFVTDPQTQNVNIKFTGPDTIFAKIVRSVQDYAEIYFIGNPQVGAGGESQVTECVMWVNVNTNTSGGELRSTGRWTDLEDHMHLTLETPEEIQVWFAVPEGWIWRVDDNVATAGNSVWPSIQTP